MAEIAVERAVSCTSSPEALWPHLTDSERVNRAIGLGPIELSPNDDATAARYLVKTMSGGFPLEYEERPFEWVAPERFSVRRIVRRGLVSSLEHRFLLEPNPEGQGTRVTLRVAVVPKSALIAPLVRFQLARFAGKLARFVEEVDREVQTGVRGSATRTASRVDEGTLARLGEGLVARLEGDEKSAAERLLELVRTGSDQEVDRIRPYELARAWNLPRRSVLGASLEAVSSGVLELTWDLVCPSCRTASERIRALSTLDTHAHCQVCDLSYDLDLDRAVEATFRPPNAIRNVDEGPYCIGGPARTPHVLTQAILPGNGTTEVRAPQALGRYRLFVRGGPAAILVVTPEGSPRFDGRASEGALEPARADVAPGALVSLTSDHAGERHLKIERVDFAEDAATAHELSMLPTFRRQFAREILRPGLTLRIARVSLLFSDLTGSTALYANIGDAKAFGFVQDHFELLSRIVARHSGTVVKTIGDAVMAAFGAEEDAVRASVDMHSQFPQLRQSHEEASGVRLKLGVYAGPCYVVTANQTLDYFGHTVNVAARLQGAAEGGEVVLTAELAETALREGWLPKDAPSQSFDAHLKGLARTLRLFRARLDGS